MISFVSWGRGFCQQFADKVAFMWSACLEPNCNLKQWHFLQSKLFYDQTARLSYANSIHMHIHNSGKLSMPLPQLYYVGDIVRLFNLQEFSEACKFMSLSRDGCPHKSYHPIYFDTVGCSDNIPYSFIINLCTRMCYCLEVWNSCPEKKEDKI